MAPSPASMPIQVKNTFVDFGRQITVEDDLDTLTEEGKTFAQRQVTEPAPVNRRQLYMTPPDSVDRVLQAALRRDSAAQEPEMEPRRQHTSDSSEPRRQATERSTDGEDYVSDLLRGVRSASAEQQAADGDPEELMSDWDWNRFVTHGSLDNFHPAICPVDEVPAPFANLPLLPGWSPPDVTQYQLPLISFAPPASKPPEEWGDALTVMMRNLPNKFSQQMLLEDINVAGFVGTYDFLYLPIDPETKANRGYAFINFTDPVHSWNFKCFYEGRQIGQFNSGKVVTVMPATLQGYEANYSHYSSARVSRGDVGSRPLFLRDPPAKQGPAPTQRRRRGRMSLIDAAAKKQTVQARAEGDVAAGSGRETPAPAEAAPEEGRAIRFCPFCGGKVCNGFKFCQFCGSGLPV